MTKVENRIWFLGEDGRAPKTLYVMYDNIINPDAVITFKRGLLNDLLGFKYGLSLHYDHKKCNIDYLYKVSDKIVKFHAANTDEKDDEVLKSWHITCIALEAINKHYETITLVKSELQKETDLLKKSSNLAKVTSLTFNVEDNKWAKPGHILKWDFLPNSTAIPLANKKALRLLEQEAPGEFQAIPAKILMPDGSSIEEYTLINVVNKIKALNEEKSILKEEKYRTEWSMYKTHYYNQNAMKDFNIAIDEEIIFFGSEKLRKAIKKAKLIGLQFKDRYGTSHFFLDDEMAGNESKK